MNSMIFEKLQKTISVYNALEFNEVVNYNKFNDYAITAHSTQVEGSTLTKEETTLLLDENLTPKGKPLEHALMVKDHYKALLLIHKLAQSKLNFTPELIQEINANVMRSIGGDVDSAKGELKKSSVYVAERFFPDQNKVPELLKTLCLELNSKIKSVKTLEDQIKLSYNAHFNLVSIHPFYDGNGRTSRLLMNLIQEYFGIPLSVVYKEDKAEYYNALEESREKENLKPLQDFMATEHHKYLTAEIETYKKQQDKMNGGFSFMF